MDGVGVHRFVARPFVCGGRVQGPLRRRCQGCRHGVGLHAVRVGQGPGGDVVRHAVAQLRVGVHEDLEQGRLGLVRVDDQVVGPDADLAVAHAKVLEALAVRGLARFAVADAVGVEQVGDPRQLGGAVGRREDVGLVVAPRHFGVAAVVRRKFFQHPVHVLAGAFDGGEARLHVVLDPVAEGERVTDGGLDGAPRASTAALFVGHAHGALEHGPRVAIRGIEEVKHLFGEVKRTPLVEVLRVVLADVPLAFALPRRDHLVVRLSCRSEVVGAVDALLVEVDVHLGHPFAVEGGPRLGFSLGLPGQIPVHVKQVVVRPSAWPRLVVLPRVGVGVHAARGRHVLKMHVPVAPVWVHAWIQDHHGLVQQVCVARGQRLHGGHRRFGAHRLVAVNVVTQVHPCHAVASVNPLVHAQRVVCLEHVKAFHVGGGGHDQPQQRAPFRGGAVLG